VTRYSFASLTVAVPETKTEASAKELILICDATKNVLIFSDMENRNKWKECIVSTIEAHLEHLRTASNKKGWRNTMSDCVIC